MRLLHTSDWHLGASIKQVDCHEEQRRFLDWLAETLAERAIDVLVVAGDVFHYASPSNAAQKLYYGFLARCSTIDSLRKIVIVAGNHDSPSGLEAPRELLDHLDVHVVGALPRDEDQWKDCLVPVANDDGEVELVVAAVPYVQEARLGVSLGDDGEAELRQQYQEAFERLYATLADQALERWPDARLVATGHLTIYGEGNEPKKGDFHSEIHRTARPVPETADDGLQELQRIGTIEAMGPHIFDERFSYVALGHIHRPMPVGGTRHIRYCGTPVATSLDEGSPNAPKRQVIEVELSPAPVRDQTSGGQISILEQAPDELPIEVISVPRWREIFEIVGTEDELRDRLSTMHSDAELPPAVFVRVNLGFDDVAGADRLGSFKKLIEEQHPEGSRPIIVELREQFAVADDGGERVTRTLPPFEDLTYLQVFEAMYRRQHPGQDKVPDRLVEKFRTIAQLLHDTDEGAQ